MFCDVHVTEAWNTPATIGDSAQLCYLDKIAGGRSSWVLALKSRIKESFNGFFFKMRMMSYPRKGTAWNDSSKS